MQFIGQPHITSFFDLAFKHSSLGQSYCFVGASQIGKRTLANNLAAQILDVELEKLKFNPDYYYLERQEEEKTGKKKKEISVNQARELRDKLYNRSWFNGYKVAIIDEAELLNEESGNALLKIIEEPPAKSIIFLLTENDSWLLPTIRSRCQIFQFVPVSDEEISKLVTAVSDISDTKEIVELAWGRPGRAINLCQDFELLGSCLKEKTRWQKIITTPIHERWQEMEEVLSEKGGLIKTKEKLDPILDFWTMLWREKMLSDKNFDDQYRIIIDEIKNVKNLLSANVNPRLVVENFLTKF
ncbi:MAG: hypothetical protein WCT11_00365 [Candidatus Magasanikbacteria bacterium]